MTKVIKEKNKVLVLEAFDTLICQRDYVVDESYWSPRYIQLSVRIAPGREGLFSLVKSTPPTLKYESGKQDCSRILRIKEPWDVIQDAANQEQSKSRLPMSGTSFRILCRDETGVIRE